MKRRRTDWFCVGCQRPLRENGDSITPRVDGSNTFYVHDQCGKTVTPEGRSIKPSPPPGAERAK